MTRRVCAGLFGIYAAVMIWLLFLQRTPSSLEYWDFIQQSYNLRPFATIRMQMAFLQDSWEWKYAVINLVGNIIMFVPLGLLSAIWKAQSKLGRYTLTVGISILLVELVQLFTTLGSADIDDWLFNMIGAMFGFAIWKCLCRNKRKSPGYPKTGSDGNVS